MNIRHSIMKAYLLILYFEYLNVFVLFDFKLSAFVKIAF